MGGHYAICGWCNCGRIQRLFAEINDGWALLITIVSFLSTLGPLSLLIIFYVLAKLSERFGSVVKMRPQYRYYYLALVFLTIGCIGHLLVLTADLTPANIHRWLVSPWFLMFAYYLPLTIGVTIGLIITWRYWSWLVIEHNG